MGKSIKADSLSAAKEICLAYIELMVDHGYLPFNVYMDLEAATDKELLKYFKSVQNIMNKAIDILEKKTKRRKTKVKTAKEMFADLGYSIQTDDEYCISYWNEYEGKSITFWYEDLNFEIDTVAHSKSFISVPVLHAINQQCKELEWIE